MIVEYTVATLCILMTVAFVASVKAVLERDLFKAIVFSALQSVAYALIFGILMAPDILYAYVAVSLCLYPVLLIYVVSKTYRFEGGEK